MLNLSIVWLLAKSCYYYTPHINKYVISFYIKWLSSQNPKVCDQPPQPNPLDILKIFRFLSVTSLKQTEHYRSSSPFRQIRKMFGKQYLRFRAPNLAMHLFILYSISGKEKMVAQSRPVVLILFRVTDAFKNLKKAMDPLPKKVTKTQCCIQCVQCTLLIEI